MLQSYNNPSLSQAFLGVRSSYYRPGIIDCFTKYAKIRSALERGSLQDSDGISEDGRSCAEDNEGEKHCADRISLFVICKKTRQVLNRFQSCAGLLVCNLQKFKQDKF